MLLPLALVLLSAQVSFAIDAEVTSDGREVASSIAPVHYDSAWFDMEGKQCAATVCGVCMATTDEWPAVQAEGEASGGGPRQREVKLVSNAEHSIHRPAADEVSMGPPQAVAREAAQRHHLWVPCASFMFYPPCSRLMLWGYNATLRPEELRTMHLPFRAPPPPTFPTAPTAVSDALRRFAAREKFAVYTSSRCLPHRDAFFDALAEAAEKRGLVAEAIGTCSGQRVQPQSATTTTKRRTAGLDHTFDDLKRAQVLHGDKWWVTLRGGPTFIEDAVAAMRGYRLCMAFENTNLDGYVTEKLPAAFFAGCVPVYWGHRSVFKIFNKDAFIYAGDDAHDADTILRAVALAVKVGEDPTGPLARRILSAPKLNQDNPRGVWRKFFQWEPEGAEDGEESSNNSSSSSSSSSKTRAGMSILETVREKVLSLAAASTTDFEASTAALAEEFGSDESSKDDDGHFTKGRDDWLADENNYTLEDLIKIGQQQLESRRGVRYDPSCNAAPIFEAALVRLRDQERPGGEGEGEGEGEGGDDGGAGVAAGRPVATEAKIRMSIGRALHLQGRNRDAAVEFEAAAALQPAVWMYHANLGIFYAEVGGLLDPPRGLDDSRRAFEAAIAFAPESRRVELEEQRNAVLTASGF